MGFVALIFALLIEQGRSLSGDNPVHRAAAGLADLVRAASDAGERQHGVFGWVAVVAVGVGGVALLEWLAQMLHPVALFVVHVGVLYLTIGFRQFSHAFTEIQVALASDDTDGARRVLERWLDQSDPDDLSGSAAPRDAGQRDLPAGDRACAGGCAPARLRTALLVHPAARCRGAGAVPPRRVARAALGTAVAEGARKVDEPYGDFALRAYRAIDWLPARLSAAGFAIVGNFEDAIYCWRGAVAAGTTDDQRALLLASGGGALGLRVAEPALEARWASGEQGFEWQGAEPDANGLRSSVGLVWRSVVLWISLFAMLSIAAWLGR